MKDYFLRLFRFNLWASERLASSVSTASQITPDALLLYCHTAEAGTIWLKRFKKESSIISVFEIMPVEEATTMLLNNAKEWIEYIENNFDETGLLSYNNTQGISYNNSNIDVLAHVINHATYHRGQIVKLIRPYIDKAPVTDFISYSRENS